MLRTQKHAKAFQCLNDVDMFLEFCKLYPDLKAAVSAWTFRRFKPWWIDKPRQEWVAQTPKISPHGMHPAFAFAFLNKRKGKAFLRKHCDPIITLHYITKQTKNGSEVLDIVAIFGSFHLITFSWKCWGFFFWGTCSGYFWTLHPVLSTAVRLDGQFVFVVVSLVRPACCLWCAAVPLAVPSFGHSLKFQQLHWWKLLRPCCERIGMGYGKEIKKRMCIVPVSCWNSKWMGGIDWLMNVANHQVQVLFRTFLVKTFARFRGHSARYFAE